MLEKTSVEARTIFLLKFTKELIKNSKGTEILRLEEIIRKKVGLRSLFHEAKLIPKEKIDERIREILLKRPVKKIEEVKEPSKRTMPFPQNEQKIALIVPKPRFQETQRYLNQPPIQETINFGKIDILVKDPNVNVIEFPGENQKILVEGKMGRKFTGIILTQEDAKDLVDNFSKRAQIPLNNGINKIALGNLFLTAIISGQTINHILIKKNSEINFMNLRAPSPMF